MCTLPAKEKFLRSFLQLIFNIIININKIETKRQVALNYTYWKYSQFKKESPHILSSRKGKTGGRNGKPIYLSVGSSELISFVLLKFRLLKVLKLAIWFVSRSELIGQGKVEMTTRLF